MWPPADPAGALEPPARPRSATLSNSRPGLVPPGAAVAVPAPAASSSTNESGRGPSPTQATGDKTAPPSRPSSTTLRRNKSLTHREGAGSFLHAVPDPSPIPPSLQNSPYLQSEASPFFRRARLGRAATSSVVPTLKSLNLNGGGGGGNASAPSSSGASPSAPAVALFDGELAGAGPSGDAPLSIATTGVRPSYVRPAYDRKRRSVSDSFTGRSSGSSASGDSSDSDAAPRTPVLSSNPAFVDPAALPPLAAAARAPYPVMTGSGKVHPPGKPTIAALLVNSGAITMERIARPPVHMRLADRHPSSSAPPS